MLPDVASTVSEARKAAVAALAGAGAISADSAILYDPPRHIERRALAYLVSKNVVLRTPGGLYWVDQEAAAGWRRSMNLQNAVVIGGIVAGIAAFAFTRYRKRKTQRPGEDA